MFAAHNLFLTSGGAAEEIALGLSDSLLSVTGQNASWNQQTIDISAYSGHTVRFVVKYTSAASFTGDFQIDDVAIDGTTYDFEGTGGITGWQTSSASASNTTYSDYTAVSWSSLPFPSSTAAGQWNRDAAGTPSGNTGLTVDHTLGTTSGYYLYTEVSSRFNTDFWLRSPSISLSGSAGNLTFWEARYGSDMGSSEYFLDVIS